MSEAHAIAHANIALAKYWGKADVARNLPAVPSLSLTLDALRTFTRVRFDAGLGDDRVEHDGAVAEGKANVGLVEGPTDHPALIRQPIDQDRFVLVIGAGLKPPVDDDGRLDMRAVNWVIREAGSGTRLGLEDLARREGLTLEDLNIFLELPSNEAVREAIEAGAGATIISRHVVASAIAAGRLREIPMALPRREYALLLHRERHATMAQRAFVDFLSGHAGAARPY